MSVPLRTKWLRVRLTLLSLKYISHFKFTSQIFLRTYLIMKGSFIAKVSVIFYVNASWLKNVFSDVLNFKRREPLSFPYNLIAYFTYSAPFFHIFYIGGFILLHNLYLKDLYTSQRFHLGWLNITCNWNAHNLLNFQD